MRRKSVPPPGEGGGGGTSSDGYRARLHYTTKHEPVAYRVHKPGRGDGWPIVGKLTRFQSDDEPILATAWRSQRGTRAAISMPRAVLLDAQRRGAVDFYLRDDNSQRMWRLPIAAFLRGRLQVDGEHYIKLSDLEPVPWRAWAYATRTVRLGAEPEPEPQAVQAVLAL